MRLSLISGTLCVAAVAMTTGCASVSQQKYDNLITSYRTMQENNVSLQSRVEEGNTTNDILRQRVTTAAVQQQELERDNLRLNTELDIMGTNLANLENQINIIDFSPLPIEISLKLQELADQYSGILSFDSRQGLIRFSSDLTFDLGSSELKANAQNLIAQIATIINDKALTNFEVRLVGHTDAVPITNSATKAKHPTNMHLSVHRAIAVQDALVKSKVSTARIQVAGYGPYRPLVPEGPAGAKENRRVEMFIAPMKDTGRGTTGTTPGAIVEEPMK